ncbi:MAG: hypothetical protein ACTSXP_04055 [Promethearchaeota archaeon]
MNYHHRHLWVQFKVPDGDDPINLIGIGNFSIKVTGGGKTRVFSNTLIRLQRAEKILYYRKENPPITLVRVQDRDKGFFINIRGKSRIEIQ